MNLMVVFFLCAPVITHAFDYGAIGNNAFWVVLALWSFFVAYILINKKEKVWGSIGRFATLLLSPGVKPRKVKNAHIVVLDDLPMPEVSPVAEVPHVSSISPRNESLGIERTMLTRPHQPPTRVVHAAPQPVHAPRPEHAIQPVVHSTDMSASLPILNPSAPKVPANEVQGGATNPLTKDTLTLEIIAAVPKLILKREKK